jgi:hypothetical protein
VSLLTTVVIVSIAQKTKRKIEVMISILNTIAAANKIAVPREVALMTSIISVFPLESLRE